MGQASCLSSSPSFPAVPFKAVQALSTLQIHAELDLAFCLGPRHPASSNQNRFGLRNPGTPWFGLQRKRLSGTSQCGSRIMQPATRLETAYGTLLHPAAGYEKHIQSVVERAGFGLFRAIPGYSGLIQATKKKEAWISAPGPANAVWLSFANHRGVASKRRTVDKRHLV